MIAGHSKRVDTELLASGKLVVPAQASNSNEAFRISDKRLFIAACPVSCPLAIWTGGEAADCKVYDALIGLPERTPDALLADKGYDADAIRADLGERKIEAVIPGRSNRRVKIKHDRALYKQRNRIERMFGHLKINRAVATRYDQLANSFLGMVHLATARYWLKFVHAA
jgi:transposase